MTTRIEPMVTVADLDLLPEDGNRYEVIEGELFVSRAPSLIHQQILLNLIKTFLQYLDQHPIGRIIITPGVIFSDYNGVIPDLAFIRHEQRPELASGDWVMGAPDLVIEILSPGSENEKRNRIAKRQLYGKYGVLEYWIVDLEHRTVEVYRLNEQVLELVATFSDQEGITSSVLPEFLCKVSSLFED